VWLWQKILIISRPLHSYKNKARRPPALRHSKIQHNRTCKKEQNKVIIVALGRAILPTKKIRPETPEPNPLKADRPHVPALPPKTKDPLKIAFLMLPIHVKKPHQPIKTQQVIIFGDAFDCLFGLYGRTYYGETA
jgi:hypothetical protein